MFRSKKLSFSLFMMCVVLVGVTVTALLVGGEFSRRSLQDQVFRGLEANLHSSRAAMRMLQAGFRVQQGKLYLGHVEASSSTVLVDEIQKSMGGDATIYFRDRGVMTTVRGGLDRRAATLRLPEDPGLRATVFGKLAIHRAVETDREGENVYAVYAPLTSDHGEVLGVIALTVPESDALRASRRFTLASIALACVALVLVTALFLLSRRKMMGHISEGEADLRKTNGRLDLALENMANGICMFGSDNRILVASEHYDRVLGLKPGSVEQGMHLNELVKLMMRASIGTARGSDKVFERVSEILSGSDGSAIEYPWNGRVLSVTPKTLPNGGWVVTYEDVTDRREAIDRISHMAKHDAVTGLPNRVMLRERMDEMSEAGATSVMMLDLDHFKEVNDTLGHPFGDSLLRAISSRLTEMLPEDAVLARLGGDEFVVVQAAGTQAQTAAMATAIVRAAARPFELEGHTVNIGTSIGIVMPGQGADFDTTMKQVDLALYRAKDSGRGGFAFYEPGMDQRLLERKELEADLRRAVAQEEFELHYQPLVNVQSGMVTGFEALMRWRHPVRGMVSPGDFIPLAEETGLIVPMGAWALRRACLDAVQWPNLKVAVNVSPMQFRDRSIVSVVKRALKESGLQAKNLEIEVTETAMTADHEQVLAILGGFRDLGVSVAMDDFGTGASGLSYFRQFPFGKVKIDRSFVEGVGTRRDSNAVINAVLSIGRDLGMTVLAEGVETDEQLRRLRDMGCQEAQGYLFSKPVPASEVRATVARLGVHQLARGNGGARAHATGGI